MSATTLELLASVPLFAKLPKKTIERFGRIVAEREFPAGTDIVTEGDASAAFFLITDGAVEVFRGPNRTPLATLKSGGFFGDMALLDGLPRSATVRATAPTKCLVMTRWDFLTEVRLNPEIALELLEVLSIRIRDLEKRLPD